MTTATDTTFSQAVAIGLELPGFAKLPVAAQCRQQEQLQRRLAAALQALPQKDRLVLDMPTGAAVVLFTSPAVALNIACALCGTRSAESGSITLRAGLDLGPVKAVPGRDGHPQIVGEALEIAEHIVTLVPGERVVTTRAYADALRKELPACAPALRALPKGAEPEALPCELLAVQITHPTILAYRRRRSGQSKPLFGWLTWPRAGFAAMVLTLTAFTWNTVGGSSRTQRTAQDAPSKAEVPALVEAASEPVKVVRIEPLAEASQGDGPDEQVEAPAVSTPTETPAVQNEPLPRQPRSVKVKRSMRVDPARTASGAGAPVVEAGIETPQMLAATPVEHGKVLLAIAPWGEVLVDGKAVGVSPPLTELELETGSHYLEVRNGASSPLLRRIDIKGNETLKIRHRFADSQ